MKARVSNMTSRNGEGTAPNQFIIETGAFFYFQSYKTVIARERRSDNKLTLDRDKWNYSATTSRFRNQFTGLTSKETADGIKDGTIKLTDLNK